MADEAVEGNEEAVKSKPSLGMMLVAFVLMLQCAGMGFMAYTMMNLPTQIAITLDPEAAAAAAEAKEEVEPFDPQFIQIGPMTVNIESDSAGDHILYTKMLFRADNQITVDFINGNRESIDNELIMLLSDSKKSEITTSTGKKALVSNILKHMNSVYLEDNPDLMIGTVLLKDFIVQ